MVDKVKVSVVLVQAKVTKMAREALGLRALVPDLRRDIEICLEHLGLDSDVEIVQLLTTSEPPHATLVLQTRDGVPITRLQEATDILEDELYFIPRSGLFKIPKRRHVPVQRKALRRDGL